MLCSQLFIRDFIHDWPLKMIGNVVASDITKIIGNIIY